ncbi:hypothetical protein BVRB_2g033170 [Beta vulgaris subsp. vulgaris]|uniref:Legumain prodomain domain-containing protein n=1 Tax=Beta vulgaris subsp. vulgaris TaxID=3555 RepID=A0A0J8FQC3_BETVV|nr:hypothetical protein BVRB_2g033170 [Beta vulgaris subsp. vulgaris]
MILMATIALALFFSLFVEGRLTHQMFNKFSELSSTSEAVHHPGTKWAVLVAGSNGYENYRHQADICHAYQIMKKGGLKDENIVVFMYDDIAFNKDNPKPGVIINRPRGKNVYRHVPKDYTGYNLTASNLFSVILGNKTAIKGGSGKVVKSGPNDHIFIYYSDHGGPGVLAMPDGSQMIYAKDLIDILKMKHASKSYKTMVIYVEACESGSIFDGLLPENLDIFVTTASNPTESSYATYCGGDRDVPQEYNNTCLGDLYSVSWLEDSDKTDPRKETLEQQYTLVKKRTSKLSHIMQYGDSELSTEFLSLYFISGSSKHNHTYFANQPEPITASLAVEQRSKEKIEAQKRLDDLISQRKHLDRSVQKIANVLFGEVKGPSYLTMVRPVGSPLVDDWDCLKAMVRTYEERCGLLRTYGKKYMRAFANFCNAGVHENRMAQASAQVCFM